MAKTTNKRLPRDPSVAIPPGWSRPQRGWLVQVETVVRRAGTGTFALLPDDLLVLEKTGVYWKECPGIATLVRLNPSQVRKLKEVEFIRNNLRYTVLTP